MGRLDQVQLTTRDRPKLFGKPPRCAAVEPVKDVAGGGVGEALDHCRERSACTDTVQACSASAAERADVRRRGLAAGMWLSDSVVARGRDDHSSAARWVAVLSPLAASAATFDAHGGAATPAANSPAPATREPLARPFPAHRDRDTSRHAGRGLTATNRRDRRRGSTVTAPRTPPRSGPGGSR